MPTRRCGISHGDRASAEIGGSVEQSGNRIAAQRAAGGSERDVSHGHPTAAGFHPSVLQSRDSNHGTGQYARTVALYRKGIELEPGICRIHSGLYTLYFATGMTKGQLIAEHREWARRHAEPLKAAWLPHGNSREPGRQLRIGYVSPEFKVHPVGRFILPLFVEHDRARFETFCYSGVQSPDELTAEIKSCTSGWRDIQLMPDDAVAELIRRDGIDILVDLSMHMGYRLGIFARRPAPIQITYLAYVGTTGLDAVDYRITDPFLDPPGSESEEDFCEKGVYIPSYWCYKPTIVDVDRGRRHRVEMVL